MSCQSGSRSVIRQRDIGVIIPINYLVQMPKNFCTAPETHVLHGVCFGFFLALVPGCRQESGVTVLVCHVRPDRVIIRISSNKIVSYMTVFTQGMCCGN